MCLKCFLWFVTCLCVCPCMYTSVCLCMCVWQYACTHLFLCTCVCVWVCMYTSLCLCMCVEATHSLKCHPSGAIHPLYFETGSFTGPGLNNSARLAGQWTLGNHLSLFPALESQTHVTTPSCLQGVWGLNSHPYVFVARTLLAESSSPCPGLFWDYTLP